MTHPLPDPERSPDRRGAPGGSGAADADEIVGELIDEMYTAWREGRRLTVDDLASLHPWLLDHPHSLVRLIYEELNLRKQNGEVLDPDSVLLQLRIAPPGDRPQEPAGPGSSIANGRAAGPEARDPDARLAAANLPLRGDFDRVRVARSGVWCRPRAVVRSAWTAAVLTVVAYAGLQARHQVLRAADSLGQGRALIERGAHGEAALTLVNGLDGLRYLPFGGDRLRGRLGEQLRRARRAGAADDLHRLAEQVRLACDPSRLPEGEAHALEVYFEAVWPERERLTRKDGGPLAPETERQILADLLDLSVFRAELFVGRDPGVDGGGGGERRARAVLDEAEALCGPSPVLGWHRQRLSSRSGAAGLPPLPAGATAECHTALGRSLLWAGDFDAAGRALGRALELKPQAFWPRYYLGLCGYRQGRYRESVDAFNVAVALAPGGAECYYNRALALTALGEVGRARQDYDAALRINPALGPAALNRGLLLYRMGAYPEAEADLRLALSRGEDPSTVHYHLALVQKAHGDRAAALSSLRLTRERQPASRLARDLETRLRFEP